jgi:pheromone shutdown protein TraB
MRYSQKSFFADNQTIDITPFLKQGKIYMFFFTWILDEE